MEHPCDNCGGRDNLAIRCDGTCATQRIWDKHPPIPARILITISELEERLVSMGYSLAELDEDNPYRV